jgi:hypothetical protein
MTTDKAGSIRLGFIRVHPRKSVANESAKKKPRRSGAFDLEAEVGIEPAYADLQSAA